MAAQIMPKMEIPCQSASKREMACSLEDEDEGSVFQDLQFNFYKKNSEGT